MPYPPAHRPDIGIQLQARSAGARMRSEGHLRGPDEQPAPAAQPGAQPAAQEAMTDAAAPPQDQDAQACNCANCCIHICFT